MYENQFKVTGTAINSGLGKAQTGTDQVCVCFEYVKDGETRTINWYGYFSSEKAIEIADEGLKNLGWDPREHEYAYHVLNGSDPATNPIIGKKATLVLDTEDDMDGNPRLKVKFINSMGGGLGLKERMSTEDAQAFSARMRARAGGAPVSAPRPRPAAAPQKPQRQQFPQSTLDKAKADDAFDDSIAPF